MTGLPARPNGIGLAHWVSFAAVLAATVLVYFPGLTGPFVFDDFGSLARLGELNGVRDWTTFKAYVLGGKSGPTGRPLSLLSFLLDGRTWPTEAWPFKRTNLVIHLLTGVALLLTSYEIVKVCGRSQAAAARIALVVTAAWLLHPFLVSTTLYAVQRMAQLATLFSLIGLYTYLRGRRLLDTGKRKAYLLMSAGAGVFTLLAVLSKENGILLPLLIGVAELTIFAAGRGTAAAPGRIWTFAFLGLPAILVGGYLVNYVADAGFFSINIARGYSIYERLLTESRVLVDYLAHWFIPRPVTSGVFQDHVRHSTGLMNPPTTLLSMLFHVLLIGLAVKFRKSRPAAAFAVLFFYAAQLLESTVINLELYFEHRNYLAAAFLSLPLVMLADKRLPRRVFAASATLVCIVLGAFTANGAYTWRDYDSMVEAAALAEPDSARAQQQYAIQLYNAGNVDQGFEVIETAIERMPENASLRLSRTIMLCESRSLTADEFSNMRAIVGGQPYDARLLSTYETLMTLVFNDRCPPVTALEMNELLDDMMQVDVNRNPQSLAFHQVQYLLGQVDIKLGNQELAFEHFRNSLESRPGTSRAMLMASLMANAGDYERAMRFTDMALQYQERPSGGVSSDRVTAAEIQDFRERLRGAMDENGDRPE